MTTKTENLVNGLDLEALRGAIDGIAADPKLGATNWKVQSRWTGGARSEHRMDVSIGGEKVERPFAIEVDEPLELCGTNTAPNPQEYLLSALNACMMVGYTAVAALMGIELTKLEVEVEGPIDLRGFLGIDANVPAGYGDGLKQTVRIAGDGTPEQFEELHRIVRATSPNHFNVTKAIALNSTLVVE